MSEIALLTAVRNTIRSLAEFSDREVEIEFDEWAMPQIASQYVAVMPGGVTPGPAHNTSGGVVDKVYGVNVMVVVRATRKPRDRARDLYLQNLSGLGVLLDKIESAIDFNYIVMNAANDLISPGQGFHEPLKFAGLGNMQLVSSEAFGGKSGEPQAGLKRVLMFGGARRTESR